MATLRKLSDTASFSTELLMTAPADMEVADRSKKYRDLRKDLLEGLNKKSWGLKLYVNADSEQALKKHTRNLIQAAYKWALTIELKSRHGLLLNTHLVIHESKIAATIYIYFKQEKDYLHVADNQVVEEK